MSTPSHVTTALKKFIKEVIMAKDSVLGQKLCDAFRIPKEKQRSKLELALAGKRPTITLEDIKRVAREFDKLDQQEIGTSR